MRTISTTVNVARAPIADVKDISFIDLMKTKGMATQMPGMITHCHIQVSSSHNGSFSEGLYLPEP